MVLEVTPLPEFPVAVLAIVRFVAGVKPQVDFESTGCEEALSALLALVRSDARVAPHVVHQGIAVRKHTIAFRTLKSCFFLVFLIVILHYC